MVRDEWAVFIAFDSPVPETYARDITTFVRSASGAWEHDDERRVNVRVHAPDVVRLLADEGVAAELARGFDGAGSGSRRGCSRSPECDANRGGSPG